MLYTSNYTVVQKNDPCCIFRITAQLRGYFHAYYNGFWLDAWVRCKWAKSAVFDCLVLNQEKQDAPASGSFHGNHLQLIL